MNPIANNIQFKRITGQEMLEEVKDLFFGICPIPECRPVFSEF